MCVIMKTSNQVITLKLARALLILAYTDKPPRRFVAGADAVERLEAELLEQRRKEIDGWRQLSSSLDHEV